MDLQYWSIINIKIVNCEIYLVNNLFTLLFLQISPIWGIKNEKIEVVGTLLNSSFSFLKKLLYKVIELLSLSLLSSPLFFFFSFYFQTVHKLWKLRHGCVENRTLYKLPNLWPHLHMPYLSSKLKFLLLLWFRPHNN